MLCRLHTVYKIIHCVALHTLCNITQSVSNHTVKWSIFCVTSGQIYTCQKKLHGHRPWRPWQISGMLKQKSAAPQGSPPPTQQIKIQMQISWVGRSTSGAADFCFSCLYCQKKQARSNFFPKYPCHVHKEWLETKKIRRILNPEHYRSIHFNVFNKERKYSP